MHRNFLIKRSYFWTGRIANQKNNPRKLWSSIDTLLGDSRSTKKRVFDADDFMRFFGKKVADVRKDTDDASSPAYSSRAPTSTMDSFQPLTAETARKLIESTPSKQCDLDPWPTWLLKDYAHDITSFITKLVYLSMASGMMSHILKEAYITPIIKKPPLDKIDITNYRLISNLSVISKL